MFDNLGRHAYSVIYADCPWRFRGYVSEGVPQRAQEQHYETMSFEELAAMPVLSLARPRCALFLWGIASHVAQALDLGRAWGFDYSTKAFCWAKTIAKAEEDARAFDASTWHMGMGYTSRRNTEDCWLFLRGGGPVIQSRSVRELIVAPIDKVHSRKPAEAMSRIEQLYNGPYVELFSRSHRPGWDCWGNEVGKFDG